MLGVDCARAGAVGPARQRSSRRYRRLERGRSTRRPSRPGCRWNLGQHSSTLRRRRPATECQSAERHPRVFAIEVRSAAAIRHADIIGREERPPHFSSPVPVPVPPVPPVPPVVSSLVMVLVPVAPEIVTPDGADKVTTNVCPARFTASPLIATFTVLEVRPPRMSECPEPIRSRYWRSPYRRRWRIDTHRRGGGLTASRRTSCSTYPSCSTCWRCRSITGGGATARRRRKSVLAAPADGCPGRDLSTVSA